MKKGSGVNCRKRILAIKKGEITYETETLANGGIKSIQISYFVSSKYS